MSNFEIVRRWLPEEARTAAQEAYEALDRIEDELTRLREEDKRTHRDYVKLKMRTLEAEGERDRLREALEEAVKELGAYGRDDPNTEIFAEDLAKSLERVLIRETK